MSLIDAGLVAGIIKSDTEPTELSVLWAKVINPAEPNVTVIHNYDFVAATWVPVEDQILKNSITTFRLDTPPGSPVEGEAHIVGETPTGIFVGREKDHALFLGDQWNFTTPVDGNQTIRTAGASNEIYIFKGGDDWSLYSPPPLTGTNEFTTRFNGSNDLVESDALTNNGTNLTVKEKLSIAATKTLELLGLANVSDGTGFFGFTSGNEFTFSKVARASNKAIKFATNLLTLNRIITWQNKAITVAGLSDILKTKSETKAAVSFVGNPKKATVTFIADYGFSDFADANYNAVASGEDSDGYVITIESYAADSFVINLNSNTAPSNPIRWVATKHGEST